MGNDVLEDGTAPSAGRAPSSAVTPTGTAGGATPTGERVYDEIAGGGCRHACNNIWALLPRCCCAVTLYNCTNLCQTYLDQVILR